ncbi:hypothetical protein BITS_1488 [Bifidobacterium tsurumiense]|uniref:Uncharacterized protein n=1 Tax=Bifidobacterium tsurumiense TaxID=356829 RepID=A0A087EGM4_9BIFI|nr:hypothetical protein BITS_1488 [Bifidobacterium tsurumiense]
MLATSLVSAEGVSFVATSSEPDALSPLASLFVVESGVSTVLASAVGVTSVFSAVAAGTVSSIAKDTTAAAATCSNDFLFFPLPMIPPLQCLGSTSNNISRVCPNSSKE